MNARRPDQLPVVLVQAVVVVGEAVADEQYLRGRRFASAAVTGEAAGPRMTSRAINKKGAKPPFRVC